MNGEVDLLNITEADAYNEDDETEVTQIATERKRRKMLKEARLRWKLFDGLEFCCQ